MISLQRLVIVLVIVLCGNQLYAEKRERNLGRLSGSIESSMGFYLKDEKLGITEVDNKFGTNTFLNIGYNINGFRFGLEYDVFEPPMLGFSTMLEGNKLIQGFASWANPNFEIRLGSVYEQFGSGLLFRAYEDRAMAINTSIMGGNLRWRVGDILSLKMVAGRPRKFLDYSDARIYGADLELFLNRFIGKQWDYSLSIGGGWLLRDDQSDLELSDAPSVIRSYSGRLDFSKGIFSFSGEYVYKGESLIYTNQARFLPCIGEALLMNLGLDFSGMGFSLEYRTLKNMDLWMDEESSGERLKLNYLPSLTRQHKYTLLSLFPHETKGIGETGGQFDLFGEIPLADGRPLSFSVNGSMYRELIPKEEEGEYDMFDLGGDLLFSELGIEFEKRWGKYIKTTLSGAWQKKSEFSRYGFGEQLMNTEIVVADILFKLNRKNSLRFELQHAWSDSKDDQAWWMGLVELGLAPQWIFYVSNSSNYKSYKESINFYDIGASFSLKSLRTSISYGRNRAGMDCSGGICRYVPEYSGFNVLFSLTI